MLNRTLAAVFLCVSSTLASNAHAEDSDGRWWNRLNQGEKRSYIEGFEAGSHYAVDIMTGAALNAVNDPKTGEFSASRLETVKAVTAGTTQALNHNFSKVTHGQLIDGLDATFADYRNQGLSVVDGMAVVIYEIKGASEADVAHLLEAMRRRAGK